MGLLPGKNQSAAAAGDPAFVHLHVHTHYSMLDGACRVSDLVKRTKQLGMNSLAISDHGCMFGVIEFYNECQKQGIKPILGIEAYVAPTHRTDRTTAAGESAYHLLLLAENLEGYKNLLKLSSLSYREGFYYKPRIDKQILREYSKGLIGTSACLGGEVASLIKRQNAKAAREMAEQYAGIFGPDRFFIEVQKHITEQDEVNPELVEIAKKTGLGLVATNDVHFLNQDDHFAHDCLCCISMGRLVSEENRIKYPTELYLKSPAEMLQAVGHWPGAMENTVHIAQMCNVELEFGRQYAPVYQVPSEKMRPADATHEADDARYLRQLCEDGLIWRYGTTDVSADIRARLDKELAVIIAKNFCSYFLIVWDFCNYARDNGIPVGARGSGVGTMVGYLLGLCNVDPLKYGLLFERFMDPSRKEMPDIDIDICQDGRQRIIDYVREKYGHVAQIITFGTLAAKAACKDVGRVLGVPLPEIDRLTKLIPGLPGMTLDLAMKRVPDLESLYRNDATIKKVIDIAKRLEGLCRNAGCHAAGVIIADMPLDTLVPLYRDSDGNILTQYEGPIAEKCGLLKMDFLGLKTLSAITRAVDLIKQTKGNAIDIEAIDLTDRKVLDLFCRGETAAIFQFESGGMRDLLMKMQPDRLEDLIAANALYRPGPMELIPTYCARKHGREKVPSVHPIMDNILAETYGIMVYQEQVMQIFNELGGIELSAAYKLIKAISKKTSEVIAKFRPDFIKGCTDKGVSKEQAEEIFDLILKFGGYGFNKSHSTRYAIVAFQTGYLKTYFPVEYMAASLTFEMGNTEKVVEYIEECRRMTLLDGSKGIKVLPPDINSSAKDFTPLYVTEEGGKRKKPKTEGVIRFGLAAVRGVGEKATEAIIEQREAKGRFENIYDFCDRVDQRQVSKSTLDALIKCGAFAGTGAKRSQLLAVLDAAVESGQRAQNDRRSGQLAMFGGAAASSTAAPVTGALPDLDEIEPGDLLKFEKELLGFYITSHPLTEHQINIDRYTTASTKEAMALPEGTEVTIGGMICRLKKVVTKNGRSAGQQMAIITLEDLDGQIDGTMFAETYAEVCAKYPTAVANESIVFVKGKVDKKRETPSLLINEVTPITEGVSRMTTAVVLCLDRLKHSRDVMQQVKPLLAKHKGPVRSYAEVQAAANGEAELQKVVIALPKDLAVRPSKDFEQDLEMVLGAGTIQFHGPGSKRLKRIAAMQQKALFTDTPAPPEPASIEATIATDEDAMMAAADAEMELAEAD